MAAAAVQTWSSALTILMLVGMSVSTPGCQIGTCICFNSNLPVSVCDTFYPNYPFDSNNCGTYGNNCPDGSFALNGQCFCYNDTPAAACHNSCPDFASDTDNCGTCENVCPPGSVCTNRTCVCTNSGALVSACNNTILCPNFASDKYNCGSCNFESPIGSECVDANCVCSASGFSAADCNFSCPDLLGDPNNCDTCENIRAGTCIDGQCCLGDTCTSICENLATDPNNCSRCGHVCPCGDVCSQGTCYE